MDDKYYRKVRSRPVLRGAWRHIRSNGLSSDSKETVEQIKKFDENSDVHLRRINRQLQENRFKFLPSKGIFKKNLEKKALDP